MCVRASGWIGGLVRVCAGGRGVCVCVCVCVCVRACVHVYGSRNMRRSDLNEESVLPQNVAHSSNKQTVKQII